MSERQFEGGCLCGHTRFRATGEPMMPHTCSCTMCQQYSGAPTVCWVVFPKEAVEWIGEAGMPALYRSSDFSSRAFCARCGSNLGAIDDKPTIGLLSGSFDAKDQLALRPLTHSFETSRPAWWHIDIVA